MPQPIPLVYYILSVVVLLGTILAVGSRLSCRLGRIEERLRNIESELERALKYWIAPIYNRIIERGLPNPSQLTIQDIPEDMKADIRKAVTEHPHHRLNELIVELMFKWGHKRINDLVEAK